MSPEGSRPSATSLVVHAFLSSESRQDFRDFVKQIETLDEFRYLN
ncbi:hypothetical protein RISK_003171 [Rhodopirellula islandica]|uniref:Uncharacterized protein n=1 Tax=Rhodopirellula islandica TaxID=595434 RepID=A0A0J1BE96_RHOIS|nr:hypothetical protein RISK_003171 [Rhodopirellula islandica]